MYLQAIPVSSITGGSHEDSPKVRITPAMKAGLTGNSPEIHNRALLTERRCLPNNRFENR
jgi:hypothetical protein